ncbi:hypothetical protein [Actinoplanes sp. NBRC 103695]|uniref:hypothetical protein n=1 Tax=Actinoplanes sp. NBRC 103695 TaxID=3032202 RepID=UPI0024A282B2|nr:hypothetical protein [Actinoplanes sp. NBRC 103695]GLZ00820.1 hypothetical protein Acsp02_80720 [Actinoplanes sp. NBRC 103695]
MASKGTNKAIEALQRRHEAERTALKAAVDAGAVVRRAQERRASELARLDAVVVEAEQGADFALAVLASLVAPDVTAMLTEETPARVRQGQQRASAEDVASRVGELTDSVVAVARRRGRPKGGGVRPGGGDVESAASVPAAGVERVGALAGEPPGAG